MRYKPFKQQKEFFLSDARIRCLFAAKRSGKSEICYLDTIRKAEEKPNFKPNGIDPYMVGIIAPTDSMLKRLTWPKFQAFAEPFDYEFNKTENKMLWENGTVIYGFSAEKIERMEGLKLNHIFMDEVFQMHEGVFYEALARLSDSQGSLFLAGSLGTNINNPKKTWVYELIKEKEFEGAQIWEWNTLDNPYFPKEELERLKDALDPVSFRQMFEIDWSVAGTALVYQDFNEANVIRGYQYDSRMPCYVSIDWGYAHEMACLFFQVDPRTDQVYLFDEIVSSRMELASLWDRIKQKPYNIKGWCCDIAGTQEREQSGRSNVAWFREKGVHFKYRSTAINYGIPIVRQYTLSGKGIRKFYVDEVKCPKSLDGMKNYRYPEKNGVILNENPVKKDDDCVDAIRYFFVNYMDHAIKQNRMKEFNRWGKWQISATKQSVI